MVELPLNDVRVVSFRPIGTVNVDASDDEIRNLAHDSELKSRITIFSEFKDGLDGLEGFSHIFVLAYLHKLRPDQTGVLRVRPRRLLKKGFKLEELPLVGVFAIDSPTRPNPISLSLVKLLRIDSPDLIVSGLDLFNGTPVLDIKPYRGDYRANSYELAEWYRTICLKAGEDV
jgi:tRNA-Thr(GGU) m(6)t(6)A37 methyltransferase TsaA